MKAVERADQMKTWTDLGVAMFDELTSRKAHIVYGFENFQVQVPENTEPKAKQAKWVLNGTIRIHTQREGA